MIWAKDLKDGYFKIKIKPQQTYSTAFIFAGLLLIPMVLAVGSCTALLLFTVHKSRVNVDGHSKGSIRKKLLLKE